MKPTVIFSLFLTLSLTAAIVVFAQGLSPPNDAPGAGGVAPPYVATGQPITLAYSRTDNPGNLGDILSLQAWAPDSNGTLREWANIHCSPLVATHGSDTSICTLTGNTAGTQYTMAYFASNGSCIATFGNCIAVTDASYHFSTNINLSTSMSLASCGTGSPTVTAGSNDNRGSFTTGTGAPTACTLNFANTWAATPICVGQEVGGTVAIGVTSTSGSAVVFAFGSGLTSAVINYLCAG